MCEDDENGRDTAEALSIIASVRLCVCHEEPVGIAEALATYINPFYILCPAGNSHCAVFAPGLINIHPVAATVLK
jgi:hypothetical protein